LAPSGAFGIREDYRHGGGATSPRASRSTYWTRLRRHTHKYFQAEVYRLAREIARRDGIESVLDAGCGPGHKLRRYLVPHVARSVGVDRPSCAAHWPAAEGSLAFCVIDLESASVSWGETFDLVMAVDVIEHLDDPDRLLGWLRTCGTAGAKFLLSTPERVVLRGAENLQSPKTEHVREWDRRELRRYLESRGFAVERQLLVPSYDLGMSLVMWLYRARDLLAGVPRVHTQVAIGTLR
jgi:SAM-dependent methyltransferase